MNFDDWLRHAALMVAFASVVMTVRADVAADVVIYGSSPAALTAAIEAQRHGLWRAFDDALERVDSRRLELL